MFGCCEQAVKFGEKVYYTVHPIGWLMFVREEITLSRGLLSKLCSAWVERKYAFAI